MFCICVKYVNQESLLWPHETDKQIIFLILCLLSPYSSPLWLHKFRCKTTEHKHVHELATARGDMIPLLGMINSSYGTPVFKTKTNTVWKAILYLTLLEQFDKMLVHQNEGKFGSKEYLQNTWVIGRKFRIQYKRINLNFRIVEKCWPWVH